MNLKSLFGRMSVLFAVWFALGVSSLFADATFDGCTFYSRMKIGGGGGTSGQVVDVEYEPNGDTSIEAQYRFYDKNGSQCLFCSRRTTGTTTNFAYFATVNGKPRFDYYASVDKYGDTSAAEVDKDYRLFLENGTAKIYNGDSLKSKITVGKAKYACPYRLYLFSSNGDNGFDNGARYYFDYLKVYDGPIAEGVLVRHFVPCKTAEGVVAVADIVTRKVYFNKATESQFSVNDADEIDIRPPDPASWEYQFRLGLGADLKTALGSGTEPNTPLLVRLSEEAISGFRYRDFKESDGSDLVFLDENGNYLDYEVESWDTNATSLVWVKVPSLSSSTTLTCRYGGPKYEHRSQMTWANYLAVWHMDEDKGNALDETFNGLNAVPKKYSTYTGDVNKDMIGVAGVLGQARRNATAAAAKRTWLAVPAYTPSTAGTLSCSGWYKLSGAPSSCRLMSNKSSAGEAGGFDIQMNGSSKTALYVYGGTKEKKFSATVPDMSASWVKIACVFNGDSATVYANGKRVTSGTIGSIGFNRVTSIGSNYDGSQCAWYGSYDEVRLYDGTISAARIALEYANESSAASLLYGAVKSDGDLPRLSDCAAYADDLGRLCVTGCVVRHAGEVKMTLRSGELDPVEVSLGTVEAGEGFSKTFDEVDGLLRFSDYRVTITAENGEKVSEVTLANAVRFGKPVGTDFEYRFTVKPTTETQSLLAPGFANIPMLVRLDAAHSAKLRTAGGRDILVTDESGTELPHEMVEFNPDGESFLWVKVPSLSAATVLTVYLGGVDNDRNDPKSVWSDYVGVWHFAAGEAGGKRVTDATGHALDAQAEAELSVVDGPFGAAALASGSDVTAPNYESRISVGATFSLSGWFRTPGLEEAAEVAIAQKNNLSSPLNTSWKLSTAVNGEETVLRARLGAKDYTAEVSDVRTDWHYFQVISQGGGYKVYLDGKTDPSISQTFTPSVNQEVFEIQSANSWNAEYRLRKVPVTAEQSHLEYLMMVSNLFTYGDCVVTEATAPVLGEPVIRPAGDSQFSVRETITGNMPLAGSVKMVFNGGVEEMSTGESSVPATYTSTLTPVAADTTDIVTVRAKSASGATRILDPSAFYNGELKLEVVRNATERGLTNGIFRITRADKAYDLKVNIEVLGSSTAAAGVDFAELPTMVVIPDGADSVDVLVTPIMNIHRDENAFVDLKISDGAYRIDAEQGQAQLTILNYTVPKGENVWCATAPGKASVAANWTTGIAPGEFETVVFDGDVSNADCEWDDAASHSVSNWVQRANYRGKVTVATTFAGSFDRLTVAEDMSVLGGGVSHRLHTSEDPVDTYRLNLAVGHSLIVGAGASVAADGCGSAGPRREGESCFGGSFDGHPAWGSLTEPKSVGSGADDGGASGCPAGGAIWIAVGESVILDGSIRANGCVGEVVVGGVAKTFAGSGGSVYLSCARLSGQGRISADCENTSQSSKARTGAGGRVSVVLTAGELDSFPSANLTAYAGSACVSNHAGTGTVLVRSPEKPNGVLYLADRAGKYGKDERRIRSFDGQLTDLPTNQTWKLDGIVFGDNAFLCVPSNSVLELVNGFRSVSSRASDINCGLVLNGGELKMYAGDQVMSGKWTFNPRVRYTLPGGLRLTDGANLGAIEMCENVDDGKVLPEYGICQMTVAGDLEVTEGCAIRARKCGLRKQANALGSGITGVLPQAQTHGGRVKACKNKGEAFYTAYDSVFAPALPGCAVPWPNGYNADASGGVVALEIGGALIMNGTVDVGGEPEVSVAGSNVSGGVGGSVDITAATIRGAGSIKAEGGARQDICGPGGRIAIKLTKGGATFDDFSGAVSASGRIGGSSATASSSAGSVFLRSGEDLAQGGTLRFAMSDGNRDPKNESMTEIVSLGTGGDDVLQYRKLTLELRDYGLAAVNTNLEMAALRILDANSKIDLEGHRLEVHRAWIGEDQVPVGEYSAKAQPFGDRLTDSGSGGRLVVSGYGIWVFVQ